MHTQVSLHQRYCFQPQIHSCGTGLLRDAKSFPGYLIILLTIKENKKVYVGLCLHFRCINKFVGKEYQKIKVHVLNSKDTIHLGIFSHQNNYSSTDLALRNKRRKGDVPVVVSLSSDNALNVERLSRNSNFKISPNFCEFVNFDF